MRSRSRVISSAAGDARAKSKAADITQRPSLRQLGLRPIGSVQPLARLACGVRKLFAADPRAARLLRVAPLLPEAVDEHRGNRKLVDQLRALLLGVDPFGELVVAIAVSERFDREHPVASILRVEQRLPFVV